MKSLCNNRQGGDSILCGIVVIFVVSFARKNMVVCYIRGIDFFFFQNLEKNGIFILDVINALIMSKI